MQSEPMQDSDRYGCGSNAAFVIGLIAVAVTVAGTAAAAYWLVELAGWVLA